MIIEQEYDKCDCCKLMGEVYIVEKEEDGEIKTEKLCKMCYEDLYGDVF